jgi:aspartate carbamoyltransferase catalytic subunit
VSGLVTLKGLSRPILEALIEEGARMADRIAGDRRHGSELVGAVITTAFFEPSTRTRLSFEQAAKFLGGDVMTFNPGTSSQHKGESLRDTILTLIEIGSDVLVVRHTADEGPELVAGWTDVPVINGGAGRREHPTQTLADLLTLVRHFGSVDGLTMGIVGDVANSRVAGSHMLAFPMMGVRLLVIAPGDLMPNTVPDGIEVVDDLDDALSHLDVVYLLRIQHERGAVTGFETDGAYSKRFGLNEARAGALNPKAVVMHPGPLNRGVEISNDVADGDQSLIRRQVALGVPMRMAVLANVLGATS